MSFRITLLLLVLASLIAVGCTPAAEAAAPESHEPEGQPPLDRDTQMLISEVRGATAQFHNLSVAEAAGYGKFQECFRNGEIGMGQHYVNGDLLDNELDPFQPEGLVYEPRGDGSLALVAFEYIVFEDDWESDDPPVLFGQEFHLKTNIPDTPSLWALHVWVWGHNPDGIFADWNTLVICPADLPSVDFSTR